MRKKGAIEIEQIIKWIIAIAVFVFVVLGWYGIADGKASGAIEAIKNSLRFGNG